MKYLDLLDKLSVFMKMSGIEDYCKTKCPTHGCCTENDCQNLDDCKNRAACKSYLCPDLRAKIFTNEENKLWVTMMGEVYIKVLVNTNGYNSYFRSYNEHMNNIEFSDNNLNALFINTDKIKEVLNG